MIRRVPVPKMAILVFATLMLSGCDYVRGLAQQVRVPVLTRSGKELPAVEARPYPAAAPVAGPLDIEVIRDGNAIVIDNRTTREYEGVPLWLNQEYGGRLDILPIGRGKPLALTSFVNRYGEPYPVARFLRPELDRTLVLAELVLDGKLHKLTVRLEEDWREP